MAAKSRDRSGPASDETPPRSPATIEEAWAVEPPSKVLWTARPWVTSAVRAEAGRAARKEVPRTSHAAFTPATGRDPIAILDAQEADRLPDLVPLRHARMAASPFAYYRGTPAVMAYDLAGTPRTKITVQASGDAHLSNFGLYASPERSLVFDANDFDETLPGPWEWDVKRLAASVIIAGRANGFKAAENRAATMAGVRAYRTWTARYATMDLLDVWYSQITAESIRQTLEATKLGQGPSGAQRSRNLESIFTRARSRDRLRAFNALTTVVDGRRVIMDEPPFIQHVEIPGGAPFLARVFSDYRASMAEDRREFLERYRFVDFALKVVGVGSVATRCFVVLLEGRDDDDPLLLQVKEATESVMEPYLGKSHHRNHGARVVIGQRLMQGTPDIFVGWARGAERDFYFRQLWDMKGSVDTAKLLPAGLGFYASLCGWALARSHARSGDATAIAAYLGTSDVFDSAIADFAEAYADQNERDHRAYVAAIAAGRLTTTANT
jgi:uncharacterized protein (DUF2252 family)